MATLKQKLCEYKKLYSHLPDNKKDLLVYLIKELKFSYKDIPKINSIYKNFINRKTEKLSFVLYLVPEPTPRPRTSFRTKVFYVRQSGENHALFTEIVNEVGNLPIITTACKYRLNSYLPTPQAMNKYEKFFAELGLIQAESVPDWDNLGKAYSDMIQKNLLLNDSLIVDGRSVKYYSIKPRIEVEIEYFKDYSCTFTRRKIENSKFYQDTDIERVDTAMETILRRKGETNEFSSE